MNRLSYGCATHTGHVRTHNEDTFYADPEAGIWLVADGMGGHRGGAIASSILGEYIPAEIGRGASVKEAVARSHQAILDAVEHGQGIQGMGSTVVVLHIEENHYEIAWVGDSKAYLWDGALRPLTRDHSVVQRLLDAGAIDAQEAKQHPQRSLLTQVLGSTALGQAQVDSISGTLKPKQQILLCSDGLTNEVDAEQVAAVLKQDLSPQEKVDRLIQAALDGGGKDNVTVVLVSAAAETAQDSPTTPAPPPPAATPKEDSSRENSFSRLPFGLLLLALGCSLLIWWLLKV